MKTILTKEFKNRFPTIQDEDVFYDKDRDILHIGTLKLRTGLQGEVYEVVLNEDCFDVYAIGKYGHGYCKTRKNFLGETI